jgi:hypothetical protein
LRGVSKDGRSRASWFETREGALLTMRGGGLASIGRVEVALYSKQAKPRLPESAKA